MSFENRCPDLICHLESVGAVIPWLKSKFFCFKSHFSVCLFDSVVVPFSLANTFQQTTLNNFVTGKLSSGDRQSLLVR